MAAVTQLRTDLRGVEAGPADISAVICCCSEDRWSQIVDAIESTRRQSVPALEVLVVVDHNETLRHRIDDLFGGQIRTITSRFTKGLSGARNTALADALGSVVAFLDDDATAPFDWIESLAAEFDEPSVVAVGGGAVPVWPGSPPRWFPEEFGWVVGCSYTGMPTEPTAVRNVIGCNMAIRRDEALAVGGFADALGRNGTNVAGCEETLLCIELTLAEPGRVVRFLPALTVRHSVSPNRVHPRYFLRRCYGEGQSKAIVVAEAGSVGLGAERTQVTRVLPSGVLRGFVAPLHGDAAGPVRAVMIVAGFAASALGYLRSKLRISRQARHPAPGAN